MAATIKITISSTSDGGIAQAQRDIAGLGESAEKSGKGFSSMREIATGALREIGALAVNALGQAAMAVGGFLKDSIGVAGDFEAGMNSFAAAAGKSLDEAGLKTEDFKNLFLSLGKELPVSTSEVQEAATTLIKGGIDPLILQMGGLKSSIQFAAAAGMDLNAAAELSIKQLGTFVPVTASAAEQTEFLANAQDLLVKAAGASTLDVDKLGDAMLAAAGQAKAAGVDYQDFVTTMGLISPRFGSAAEAGTSFKNFLVRLQPSTKAAQAAFEELGLMTYQTQHSFQFLKERGIDPIGMSSDEIAAQLEKFADAMGLSGKKFDEFMASFGQSAFYDAEGNFIGVREASEKLRDALGGLTDQQRIQYLQTIFGNDAMGAANALLEGGSEAYDAFAQKMADANGVQAQAATMQQGFNVAMDNLKGSLEALQITIGSALLPVLTDLFNNVLAPAVNTVTNLAAAIGGDTAAFQALSPEIQAIYLGAQQVIEIISGVIASFQNTSAEGSTLGSALDQLASVWVLLQKVATDVGNAYMAVAQAVFPIVQGFIDEHGTEIMAILKKAWDTIVQIITLALKIYDATVPPILNAIAQFIQQNHDSISRIINNAWTVIKAIIDTVLTIIQGIVQTALALMNGDFEGAYAALQTMNETVWNNIKEAISAIWDTITILLESVWNDIKAKAKGAWSAITGVISGFADDVKETISALPGQLSSIGADIINGIINGIEGAKDRLFNMLENIANDALKSAKDALGISSPSKAFAAEVGSPMAQGMALGLAGGAPMVMDAARYTAGAGLASGRSVAQTYNQQRAVTINYNGLTNAPAMDYATAGALAGIG